MSVSPIAVGSPGISAGPAAAPATGKALGGFGDMLSHAVESLDQLQRQPEQLGAQLAAGEPVELHDVMLAQDRASLGFQLALQVRNKMVEAYQDVMRIQM